MKSSLKYSFVLSALLFLLVSVNSNAENLDPKNSDVTVSNNQTVQHPSQPSAINSAKNTHEEMSELETQTIVLTGFALLGASIRRRT